MHHFVLGNHFPVFASLKSHHLHLYYLTMVAATELNDTSHADAIDSNLIIGAWWCNTVVLVTIILQIALAFIQFHNLQKSNKMLCNLLNLRLSLLKYILVPVLVSKTVSPVYGLIGQQWYSVLCRTIVITKCYSLWSSNAIYRKRLGTSSLPDGHKPSLGPIRTFHQRCSVAFTQILCHRLCSWILKVCS